MHYFTKNMLFAFYFTLLYILLYLTRKHTVYAKRKVQKNPMFSPLLNFFYVVRIFTGKWS